MSVDVLVGAAKGFDSVVFVMQFFFDRTEWSRGDEFVRLALMSQSNQPKLLSSVKYT